jgi:phosphatidylglycerophosphate synthase
MIRSIEELRRVCQPRVEPTLTSRLVRRVSIYLTWALVRTPLTANQVTVLFLVSGLTGALLLGSGGYRWTVLGVVLLQLSVLLDYSDGEVARYRKATSALGSFLDIHFHLVVHGATFAALTQAVFRDYWPSPVALWLGASAIVFASANRGLRATLTRVLEGEGEESVAEEYETVTRTARQQLGAINTVQDVLFGYRSFVFLFLLAGALLHRLDAVLVFYGAAFPVYYVAKATLIWRRLVAERAGQG